MWFWWFPISHTPITHARTAPSGTKAINVSTNRTKSTLSIRTEPPRHRRRRRPRRARTWSAAPCTRSGARRWTAGATITATTCRRSARSRTAHAGTRRGRDTFAQAGPSDGHNQKYSLVLPKPKTAHDYEIHDGYMVDTGRGDHSNVSVDSTPVVCTI